MKQKNHLFGNICVIETKICVDALKIDDLNAKILVASILRKKSFSPQLKVPTTNYLKWDANQKNHVITIFSI